MNKYKVIKELYRRQRPAILKRLREFENVLSKKDDEKIFSELCFCILTPQSKAKLCWSAVEKLKDKGLLFDGNKNQVEECLGGVRFKNKKAEYIILAREIFSTIKLLLTNYELRDTNYDLRERLVKNVKGFGYKEASHFLRNIGLGDEIAILDRHILRNLKEFGIIRQVPKLLTKKNYIQIENKLKEFAKKIKIPVSHLDLLFWSKETGEIFK